MNFTENSKYLLEQSIFNRSILTCHCVQDGWAYLSDTPSSQAYTEKVEYKYNIKRERMYVFNKAFASWDSVQEFTVTEYGSVETSPTSYKTYMVI
jgi:hypothetical protein